MKLKLQFMNNWNNIGLIVVRIPQFQFPIVCSIMIRICFILSPSSKSKTNLDRSHICTKVCIYQLISWIYMPSVAFSICASQRLESSVHTYSRDGTKTNSKFFMVHYYQHDKWNAYYLNTLLVMRAHRVYRCFMALKCMLLSPSDSIPHLQNIEHMYNYHWTCRKRLK